VIPRLPARTAILFLLSFVVNAVLVWHFHDRYWYPTDDGFYAHIAERLLNGEVLNRDIQDIHPGYINFLHALTFRLFGVDMLSLRYPLVLASLLLGCFTYAVLQRRDIVLAALASVAMNALGVVQFVDPTANWYCLPLAVFLAWWLLWLPAGHPARLPGAGFIVGVLTLFRHLSGVWVAMGLVVVALLERSSDARGRSVVLARALVTTMLSAIVGYLVLTTVLEPGGMLLMAAWPIAILVWMLVNARTSNADVAAVVASISLGAAAAALPLVLYHAYHGSLAIWLTDIVFAAAGETELPFFGGGWYGVLPIVGAYQAISSFDFVKIINGLYWVVLPLLSAVNGVLIIRALRRNVPAGELVLPILGSFYALVALLLEGPLYLYYTVGLSLASVVWLGATGTRARRAGLAVMTAALTAIAIVFHAGQSRFRTPVQILAGDRVSNVWARGEGGLDRSSLQLDRADRELYGRLVSVIHAETRPDETILALPNDAELYFLASRRNASRFFNAALGLTNDRELKDLMAVLTDRPPRLVAFRPDDKYNTEATRQVMSYVRSTYEHFATIGGLELYRLRAPRNDRK
jgi:hypothetical protein